MVGHSFCAEKTRLTLDQWKETFKATSLLGLPRPTNGHRAFASWGCKSKTAGHLNGQWEQQQKPPAAHTGCSCASGWWICGRCTNTFILSVKREDRACVCPTQTHCLLWGQRWKIPEHAGPQHTHTHTHSLNLKVSGAFSHIPPGDLAWWWLSCHVGRSEVFQSCDYHLHGNSANSQRR